MKTYSIFCNQGVAVIEYDGEHGHVDIRGAGLRVGEGRARHAILHPPADPLLGHHHHDQHRSHLPNHHSL